MAADTPDTPLKSIHEVDPDTVVWNEPPIAGKVSTGIDWFLHNQISGGIVLMTATLVALILANTAWGDEIHHFWMMELSLSLGTHTFSLSVEHFVNDGLMAIFFFVIGLEVKREVMVGELSTLRQAAMPIAGAVGGMVVPALIFTAFNFGTKGISGWGVPMATDIAFALGVLSMFGRAIPVTLKVFLAALAIADDIGAVLVIALFYTAQINWLALICGGGFLAVLAGLNYFGVRRALPYALLGLGAWLGFYYSGVHATIAGILVAFTIPARQRIHKHTFVEEAKHLIDQFMHSNEHGSSTLSNQAQQHALKEIESKVREVHTPLSILEHQLHPWNTFLILPIFALANAGVHISAETLGHLTDRVSLGIMLGLLLGKPIGIIGLSWVCVKLRLAELPAGVNWRLISAAGALGGIGFTMSLFISMQAYGTAPIMLEESKASIMLASVFAGIVGSVLLYLFKPTTTPDVAVVEAAGAAAHGH